MTQRLDQSKNIMIDEKQGEFSKTKSKKQSVVTATDLQVARLREAFIMSIEQNQILRARLIEMQALLAAASQQIQFVKTKYVQDLNRLYPRIQKVCSNEKRSKSL